MTLNNQSQVGPGYVVKWVGAIVLAFVALLLLLGGCSAGYQAFGRYQQRQNLNQNRQQRVYNEKNLIHVNRIKIAQTDQLVKVAEQNARIRYENAVGIRRAQNEISGTLTPLYVQFEMVQALEQLGASGRNNTVVFIPTGADGRPIAAPQINAVNPHAGTP